MATFTVTALTDDGAGGALTLREAIELANAAEGADEIRFTEGLAGRITLNGEALVITDALSIDGGTGAFGSPDITVSGAGTSGVFEVQGTAVTLQDLGVTGGVAASGAGLLMDAGSEVVLDGTVFADNQATGDGADQGGGGVYNAGGTLTIQGATFRDNAASGLVGSGGHVFSTGADAVLTVEGSAMEGGSASRAGGAIEIGGGDATIRDSLLTLNATGAVPGNGGALHVTVAGEVLIEDSYILSNVASSEGGGLWNNAGATMTVRDTVIRGNVAEGASSDEGGGGIFNNGGTLIVEGGTLADNGASGAAGSGGNLLSTDGDVIVAGTVVTGGTASRAGGGIEVIEGSLDVAGAYFEGNGTGAAPGNGGGIHSTGAAAMTVSDSVFVRNAAAAEGGAIWNSATGSLTVSEVLFRDNAAAGDGADQGGGALFNDGGTLVVERSIFDRNEATGAAGSGGHLLSVDGDVDLQGIIMAQGAATRAGGAIEVIAGDLTVQGGEFTANATGAAPGNGGAIHVTADAATSFSDVEFFDNFASAEGGAIWNSATGSMIVSGARFFGNAAAGDGADQGGGAAFNDGGLLLVENATFDTNAATGAAGSGGHILSVDGEVTVVNASFFDGGATRAGGAIEVIDGALDVLDALFSGNGAGDAPGNGGAIHSTGTAAMTVAFSDFEFNAATNEGGAIWNSATGTLDLVASTFFANEAPAGGALFSDGGLLSIGFGPEGQLTLFQADDREGGTITAVGDGPLLLEGVEFIDGGLVLGSGGRDVIDGGATDVDIEGGDGVDVLLGGGGINILTGGGGSDVFAFRAGDGLSILTDFGAADLIALDDGFFGFGDAGVDPRAVTQAQADSALASGRFAYDGATGEITIDADGAAGPEAGRVVAVIEGGGPISADDFLLF